MYLNLIISIMADLETYEQAEVFGLAALRFDLGMSNKAIKEQFDNGFYLKYNSVANYWYFINNKLKFNK